MCTSNGIRVRRSQCLWSHDIHTFSSLFFSRHCSSYNHLDFFPCYVVNLTFSCCTLSSPSLKHFPASCFLYTVLKLNMLKPSLLNNKSVSFSSALSLARSMGNVLYICLHSIIYNCIRII